MRCNRLPNIERSGRPLIETVGLDKHYHLGSQVVHALRGVSVAIQAGEMVAIIRDRAPRAKIRTTPSSCRSRQRRRGFWA